MAKRIKRHPPLPATKHVKAHQVLQVFADKMKSGMSDTDAYNQVLQELGGEPSGAFGGSARQEISQLIFNTPQGKATIRAHSPPTEWDVNSLDVWGNEEDGFEVNDERRVQSIKIPYAASDNELLKIFKDEGLLKESVTLSQVDFEDDSSEGFFAVRDSKTSEPVYHVYLKH